MTTRVEEQNRLGGKVISFDLAAARKGKISTRARAARIANLLGQDQGSKETSTHEIIAKASLHIHFERVSP